MRDLPVQFPPEGTHRLLHCGDVLYMELIYSGKGRAFVRTNLGNAAVRRAETISMTESGMATAGQDWHDIPMTDTGNGVYTLYLGMVESGHFEAKCFFMPENSEKAVWPEGRNVHINVSPADYCCANSIYCAFVRQFGPNKELAKTRPSGRLSVENELDNAGYTVIPKSGTFRDLIRELDHIFNKLNCRILHLLPVNPTPTVYGRMGRFGSPYASLDFTAVDPSYAEFDRKATPLDQFLELVDAVHGHNGRIFIDIAVNHTGWAAKLHETHPEWLKYDREGSIISPGAWGDVWADLTSLNYDKRELWQYIADVFLTWCARGVDGFRCDAGYMIPVPAWEYIIARVRTEYPSTIFLLEGLGGDPAVTSKLLDIANMNWAYSELFQNYSKEQVEGYLKYAWKQSSGDGLMVHYAETHDNNRLAAVSKPYAEMRTALCALASSNGAFGFANGVEWFATEKIDVHESSGLSWGAEPNMTELIGSLNRLLKEHPAFQNGASLQILNNSSASTVVFLRTDSSGKYSVLVMVNLDCEHENHVSWGIVEGVCEADCSLTDMISGRCIKPLFMEGKLNLIIPPGTVFCLSPQKEFPAPEISKLELQKAQDMALKTLCCFRSSNAMQPDEHPAEIARVLLKSPEDFLKIVEADCFERCFMTWKLPEDLSRNFMIPPGKYLLVLSPFRFRASLVIDDHVVRQYDSLTDSAGRCFAIFTPVNVKDRHKPAVLKFAVYENTGTLHRAEAHLLFLAPEIQWTATFYGHDEIMNNPLVFMQANGRGAISHIRLDLPNFGSRYDAVMLANLGTEYPEDRHIMLRRVRLFMLYHARMQEVALNCVTSFNTAVDGGGLWFFKIPAGNGMYVSACMKISLDTGKNVSRISLIRYACKNKEHALDDHLPVRFLVRFDVEDRSFHNSTKAQSVEKVWPERVRSIQSAFSFAPDPSRDLTVIAGNGEFVRKDEWMYMIYQPNEASRGLDPYTDLYSPGYFEVPMLGGDTVQFCATIRTPMEPEAAVPAYVNEEAFTPNREQVLEKAFLSSIRAFIAKRGKYKTVIAGYPWFLDWGRDTLIAVRGLIASGAFKQEVRDILCQFAAFAENGTIPNVIYGDDARNRDTSDAPLWLITAVADLCKKEGSQEFLKTEVRPGTTLLAVLKSIIDGIRKGTPNGIKMDPASGLVFSPAHFTWMDTNYPAGTPREGYPVEIQALWYAALKFLSEAEDGDSALAELAGKVKTSINTLFRKEGMPYLSDCLHGRPGTPAAEAVADDHLRPNQLLAITLGAVTDREFCKEILHETSSLLIPGAIRSLADRPVHYLLPVKSASGTMLNNPAKPYWGRYEGDEDTRRKAAYHNGTAWTWLAPSYPEAYVMTYGSIGRTTALSLISTAEWLFHGGCIGQLPEILDGDYPHKPRGCDAQAWGITEHYRVWKLIREM